MEGKPVTVLMCDVCGEMHAAGSGQETAESVVCGECIKRAQTCKTVASEVVTDAHPMEAWRDLGENGAG